MIYSQNNSDDDLNYYITLFPFAKIKSCVMRIIYGGYVCMNADYRKLDRWKKFFFYQFT